MTRAQALREARTYSLPEVGTYEREALALAAERGGGPVAMHPSLRAVWWVECSEGARLTLPGLRVAGIVAALDREEVASCSS